MFGDQSLNYRGGGVGEKVGEIWDIEVIIENRTFEMGYPRYSVFCFCFKFLEVCLLAALLLEMGV